MKHNATKKIPTLMALQVSRGVIDLLEYWTGYFFLMYFWVSISIFSFFFFFFLMISLTQFTFPFTVFILCLFNELNDISLSPLKSIFTRYSYLMLQILLTKEILSKARYIFGLVYRVRNQLEWLQKNSKGQFHRHTRIFFSTVLA